MATVAFFTPTNMATAQVWLGTVTVATSTQITIASGTHTGTYFGSFSYVGSTVFGILTAYTEKSGSTVIEQITGLSVDANTAFNDINGNQLQSLFATALSGNDSISGSFGNDLLNGYAGNDTLSGGGGFSDTLAGGTGDDVYVLGGAFDTVVLENANEGIDTVLCSVPYVLGPNVENLTLTGGFAWGTGNELNNVLTSGDLADTLDGGAGADTMIGGARDTTFIVDNPGDVIVESYLGFSDHDTVQASISYTLGANLEILTLTGAAAINGTGNALDNVITGNAAANTLDGGTGADTMIGGGGDDIYYVDNAGDVVTENGGGGNDWVYTTLASFTLPNNVEIMTLNGSGPANATGNAGDNVMFGNAWNNYFDGGTGADFMAGGMGDDAYWVDNASDVVYEKPGEGGDTIVTVINYQLFAGSDVEAIVMLDQGGNINAVGSDFDNLIQGNNFDNVIVGRGGNDRLWGFAGADRFIFQTGDGHDTIYDYNHAVQGDYLDIRVSGYTTVAQILAASHDNGTDTTIQFNATDAITLNNVTVAQLSASDFLIIPP